MGEDSGQRLQVFLAHAGIASRRAAEEIIAAGRVSVNGEVVSVPGSKVSPGDTILLDGEPVQAECRKVYLALNKPPGYICSSSDPQGRPLALGLLPGEINERMYNVGRLDFMSCGLIFFTNDGAFAAKLGHPSSGLEKEYLVEATGHIPDETIDAFLRGITIEGVRYKAEAVHRVGSRAVRIVLIEGKNREIRKVFSHFHLHPSRLRRTRIGPVQLGDLPEGASRHLTSTELEALQTNPAPRSPNPRSLIPIPHSPFPIPNSPLPRRTTW
ncbi:MAG: rRNA pseudouridine synthase [Treponema sp.]|jgi:23S rRNA pseudouridine2605 synthase|nr:rRNA pseudouridine synthase [Treponema sp.]